MNPWTAPISQHFQVAGGCRSMGFLLGIFLFAGVGFSPLHAEGDAYVPAVQNATLEPGFQISAESDLILSPLGDRKAQAMAEFVKAFIAEDDGDSEAALAAYLRVLDLDPTYSELAIKIALELARQGRVSDGINLLKDSIKAVPGKPMPLLCVAQLYSRFLKKPDLAEKYLREAIKVAPSVFAPWQELYDIKRSAGLAEQANAVLDEAAKSKTVNPEFWLNLAELASQPFLNETAKADPDLVARINGFLDKTREFGGDNTLLLGGVGDVLVITRQIEEAIPVYLKVAELKPKPEDPFIMRVLEKLGRCYLSLGQKADAIRIFEEITKANPDRQETREILGELYEQEGETGKALEHFSRGIDLENAQPEHFVRLANLMLEAKDSERAVEMLRKARAKFPDLPVIALRLAMTLSLAKQHDEALAMFETAKLELSDERPEAVNAEFYFSYGAAAEQAGKLDQAAELLKKTIELDPNFAEAYNYLGYMWIDKDLQLDEAGELIRRALEFDPENAAYLDSMGWFYFKKGEYEKALTELLRAAEKIVPADAVVFDHVGDTYHKLGKIADALIYWQKASALEPDNKTIAEKIEKVRTKVTSAPKSPADPGR